MKKTLLSIILTAVFTVGAAQEIVVNEDLTYPLAQLLYCTLAYDDVAEATQAVFHFSDGTQLTISDLKTLSFISNASGLNGLDRQTSVHVYPNPALDVVTIENAEQGQMTVYSLSGNIVMQETLTDGQNQVSVSQLQEGIYMLQINNQVFKLNKK